MSEYGQYCPVAKGAEVFAQRWTPLLLRELLRGSTHFNDLHRGVPLMSRSMLSRRMKELTTIGVVARKRGAHGTEYHLTQAGRELAPVVKSLGEWGQRWFRSRFDADEIDAGVLMWDMRHGVDTAAFRAHVVVQFEFSDQPSAKRRWWFVNERDDVDLCPTDPGLEVNLYVTTTVSTLTRIWMGDLRAAAAIDCGQLRLTGPRELRQRFPRWLSTSAYASIPDGRGEVENVVPAEGLRPAIPR
jgi:DNA-binding HxlR family transcriptional regulator